MAKHAAAAANPDPRHGGLPQCKHTMLCGDVLYVQDGPRGLDPEEIQFPGKFCTFSTYVLICMYVSHVDPAGPFQLPVVYAYLMLICRRILWKWPSKSYTPITRPLSPSFGDLLCRAQRAFRSKGSMLTKPQRGGRTSRKEAAYA